MPTYYRPATADDFKNAEPMVDGGVFDKRIREILQDRPTRRTLAKACTFIRNTIGISIQDARKLILRMLIAEKARTDFEIGKPIFVAYTDDDLLTDLNQPTVGYEITKDGIAPVNLE